MSMHETKLAPLPGLSAVSFRFPMAGGTETEPDVKPDSKPGVDDPDTGPGGIPNDPGSPPDPSQPSRRYPPNCPTVHPGKPCRE